MRRRKRRSSVVFLYPRKSKPRCSANSCNRSFSETSLAMLRFALRKELGKSFTYSIQRHGNVHATGVDGGLRHNAVFRGRRLLRYRDSPSTLDGGDSIRSVTIGAAQDNPDGPFAVGSRHRPKHNIDGGPGKANQSRMRELNSTLRDQKMLIRRANVNGTVGYRFAILRLLHGLPGFACQKSCHLAFVAGVEMLNDNDGWEIGIDRTEHVNQGR